jgi:hypothetical protein
MEAILCSMHIIIERRIDIEIEIERREKVRRWWGKRKEEREMTG